MAKVSNKLDPHSREKKNKLPSQGAILQLSQKALQQFAESDSVNIVEDAEQKLKIVRLLDQEENSIYFLVTEKLGAGAFGEVSCGIQLDIQSGTVIPNTEVAIKITDYSAGGTLGKLDVESARKETEHEYNILSRIQQSRGFSLGERVKNVKQEFEDITIEREVKVQEAVVAMPLHPGNDMKNKAHNDKYSYGSLSFVQLASTLCANLKLLHDNNIIHSDLKPANIIWDAETAQANIVDFNRAKLISNNETHVYTSASSDRAYMAADCFTDRGYRFSKASDVYSLGKILGEKFDITLKNGQKESLNNKHYLSYEQLMTKHFLEKMTSADESQRPTMQECLQFFTQIENKMQLDLEQPNNRMRLELSRKIINLEVYANQLKGEIANQSQFGTLLTATGLTADKHKKYEETIKAMELLTQALSTPHIDKELLKSYQQELKRLDANANGFFSFKGRFNNIIGSIDKSINDQNEEESSIIPVM